MKKTIIVFLLLFTLPGVLFALTLPDPGDSFDGVAAAIQYDDFYSFSLKLLEDLRTTAPASTEMTSFTTFDYTAGVGGQDVVLYTQSKGTSNSSLGPDKNIVLEDPAIDTAGAPTGSYSGEWGAGDQTNGPVTVDQLLTYLHSYNPLNYTPVFLLDLNQEGGDPDMLAWGRVYLTDDLTTKTPIAEWAFDNLTNGVYDDDEPILVPATITTGEGPIPPSTSGTVYEGEHNKGSGKADFAIYAPTMNLDDFDLETYGKTLYFITEFNFDWLNDGAEELFLTSLLVPSDVPPIPEPSTIVLLLAGVLGLYVHQRRKNNS